MEKFVPLQPAALLPVVALVVHSFDPDVFAVDVKPKTMVPVVGSMSSVADELLAVIVPADDDTVHARAVGPGSFAVTLRPESAPMPAGIATETHEMLPVGEPELVLVVVSV